MGGSRSLLGEGSRRTSLESESSHRKSVKGNEFVSNSVWNDYCDNPDILKVSTVCSLARYPWPYGLSHRVCTSASTYKRGVCTCVCVGGWTCRLVEKLEMEYSSTATGVMAPGENHDSEQHHAWNSSCMCTVVALNLETFGLTMCSVTPRLFMEGALLNRERSGSWPGGSERANSLDGASKLSRLSFGWMIKSGLSAATVPKYNKPHYAYKLSSWWLARFV